MSRDNGLALLRRARTADAVTTALSVVSADNPRLHAAILERYDQMREEPRRLDSDCGIRVALLRGLLQCVLASDLHLLEAAVQTYEFGVCGEVACNLRAAALLALAQIDERLATFHATRLLADKFTAKGSREPALTAARLLAATGQHLPLYLHLLQDGAVGEEAAECFRALTDAPGSVLLHLAEHWQSSADEHALLGLFDALLGHQELDRFTAFVMRFIEESPLLDLVGYVATAILADRRETLIEPLRDRANLPGARGKAVREALDLRPA